LKKGGKPFIYKIMRLMEPESGWQFVDAVHFGATVLNGQPKGQSLKFRVITFNKAGDGTLSNTYQG